MFFKFFTVLLTYIQVINNFILKHIHQLYKSFNFKLYKKMPVVLKTEAGFFSVEFHWDR